MSNLSINVQVGVTPPSNATANGPSLSVSAWKASLFIRNPARSTSVPAGSADSTQTTDASGNATFTGLSSVDYWILVIDARGINNWFPCPAARVGGADPFVCTIPWSTPTNVTAPADDRGGDTIGNRTNQGLWSPRTHFHELGTPAASPNPFTARFRIDDSGGTGQDSQLDQNTTPFLFSGLFRYFAQLTTSILHITGAREWLPVVTWPTFSTYDNPFNMVWNAYVQDVGLSNIIIVSYSDLGVVPVSGADHGPTSWSSSNVTFSSGTDLSVQNIDQSIRAAGAVNGYVVKLSVQAFGGPLHV